MKSMHILLLHAVLALAPLTAWSANAPSGFLDDYPQMLPDAQRPGATVYRNPAKPLKGYDKVSIDPIQIMYSPDSKYKGIEPKELAAITGAFEEALAADLEPAYPVVGTSGEGVLRLRIAITNVSAEKKKKSILNFTPLGLAVGAAKSLSGVAPNVNLTEATVEAELLDGATDERIAVVVEPLLSGKAKGEKLTWDKIGGVLDAYGQRLRARMDEANN